MFYESHLLNKLESRNHDKDFQSDEHCYISVTHLIHSIYNSRTSDHHKQSAMTQQREEEHTQILLVLETRKITNRYDSSVVFQPY